MTLSRRTWLIAAAGLAGLRPGWAESLPDLIDRAKRSVVLVGTYGALDSPRFGFHGTGFAVADGQHIVTNAHVVSQDGGVALAAGRPLAVQVWSPETQWTLREVAVVALDRPHDLALLKLSGPPLPALKVAASEAREGTAVALIGFPLGGALGYSHVTHRGIVSARTAIVPPASSPSGLSERAIKQLRQGSFDVIQLDATAYPGNSGGPVLDIETGEVVGVMSMVLVKGTREAALSAPSGISYAVTARDLTALLNSR